MVRAKAINIFFISNLLIEGDIWLSNVTVNPNGIICKDSGVSPKSAPRYHMSKFM